MQAQGAFSSRKHGPFVVSLDLRRFRCRREVPGTDASETLPLSLPCIKNASEGSESGRFGQYRSGTRHRENPYYLGLFSSHTERPGPLGGTSNPAGATKNSLFCQDFSRVWQPQGQPAPHLQTTIQRLLRPSYLHSPPQQTYKFQAISLREFAIAPDSGDTQPTTPARTFAALVTTR